MASTWGLWSARSSNVGHAHILDRLIKLDHIFQMSQDILTYGTSLEMASQSRERNMLTSVQRACLVYRRVQGSWCSRAGICAGKPRAKFNLLTLCICHDIKGKILAIYVQEGATQVSTYIYVQIARQFCGPWKHQRWYWSRSQNVGKQFGSYLARKRLCSSESHVTARFRRLD
jgi:hypothetical protein